jgi:hypothetical protein
VILLASNFALDAQSWSQRAANTATALWPNAPSSQGESASLQGNGLTLLLNGVDAEWYNTANGSYYRYEKQKIDTLLASENDVDLRTRMVIARPILRIGRVTQDTGYLKTADLLDKSLCEIADSSSADGLGTDL